MFVQSFLEKYSHNCRTYGLDPINLNILYLKTPHHLKLPCKTDLHLKQIITPFMEFEFLKSIDLSFNHLTDDGAICLSDFLRDSKLLESLNLQGNNFTHVGAKSLADALNHNSTLSSLNLSTNDINEGTMSITAMLQVNACLKHLFLSRCCIPLRAFVVLMHVGKKLETLDISSNQTLSVFSHFPKLLEGSLETLFAARMQITDHVFHLHIYPALFSSILRILDLTANHLMQDSAKLVADVLRRCGLLQTLCLDYNNIGDTGAVYIADALLCNSSLKVLGLNNCGISEKGLCALGSSSKKSDFNIRLWGNSFSHKSCEQWESAVCTIDFVIYKVDNELFAAYKNV